MYGEFYARPSDHFTGWRRRHVGYYHFHQPSPSALASVTPKDPLSVVIFFYLFALL